ncbi:hypothetical protein DFJ58DRAFT_290984 [Suillus subalutaceus]|uniref:uncharacterized protein n=1 Tax=Suillus subalutaceus TaxID=48586 RepID=UPI001B886E8E|nr:uncharacterized protein DFJ58DRAFT_290984 [Suillus subalutaceus]KAG1858959.1 hypothetical protein DFJ58DRAFT_290984 [Suillus subalutaceus]
MSLPPMAASSKPTDESSHSYDTPPNDQDFDWMISDAMSTADTRTDFYDRSLTSRRYALVGVACSSIFSCLCIVAGIITLANHGISTVAVVNLINPDKYVQLFLQEEMVPLAFNLIVTLCTESIGFIHGISLRSALASESRLRFNTNLRLLAAARGWYNPNGTLLNSISAALLIISYSLASFVVCSDFQILMAPIEVEGISIAIAGLPLLILGVVLLLQVMIALSGMRAVKILTWSSSPFNLTAALVHHTQLNPATLRCMHCVSDLDTYGGPARPSDMQPSSWHAHPSIRKVVISLWVIVAAYAGWATLVMYIWDRFHHPDSAEVLGSGSALTLQTWSFLPNGVEDSFIEYRLWGSNLEVWTLLFVNMAVVQGPLTLGLHCSELIANVIRDERQWRCATGRKGLRTATNPVKTIFIHPICLVLFAAKPFLHWMFGLSFTAVNPAIDGELVEGGLTVIIHTAQIWNLCIALFIFASLFTFVALRRPRGPQPAAYGHLQTLANLVDEWSPVMWWGHKKDGIPYCHAGTSDEGPLPDVKMDCVYAGSGAEPLVPPSLACFAF